MDTRIKLALAGGLALASLGFTAGIASAMPTALLNAGIAQGAMPQVQTARYICGYWGCRWVPGPYYYGYRRYYWHRHPYYWRHRYWHRWHRW